MKLRHPNPVFSIHRSIPADPAMIRDVTSSVIQSLNTDLIAAIDALTVLNKLFFRQETRSAALGEVSESLIGQYVGAPRTTPQTKGHDLLHPDGRRIEVKSRIIDRYGDNTHYSFRKHSADAATAYCVGWSLNTTPGRPMLAHVFEIDVAYLITAFAKPEQPLYCARPTIGQLKAALRHREVQLVGPETG